MKLCGTAVGSVRAGWFRRSTCASLLALFSLLVFSLPLTAQVGKPGTTTVVPDEFLRRWDPRTVFFAAPTGPAADKAFAEAEDLAKEFGVELPALPPLKGDRAADGAAALHYALDEAGKPLLAEISKKHGADAAALFEMAFKAETLQMLYIGEPGDKIVEAVANNIKGNTARARLPAELSKPLLEKLAANVPPEKLGEALDAWERVIAAQLAAERQ